MRIIKTKCKVKSSCDNLSCSSKAPDTMLFCSRELGHEGKHHAHGIWDCFKVWDNENNP